MRRTTMTVLVAVGCALAAFGARADDGAEAFSRQADGLHAAGMGLVVTVDDSLTPVGIDNHDVELPSGAHRRIAVTGYFGVDVALLVRIVTADGGPVDQIKDLPVHRIDGLDFHQRDRCLAPADAVAVASDDDLSYLVAHGFSPQPAVFLLDSIRTAPDGRGLLVITYARRAPGCSDTTLSPEWRATVEHDLDATVSLRPPAKTSAPTGD